MTSIGSKSRSNKGKSVDSEKSAVRTATMESWTGAMQNQDGWRKEKEELEEELSKSKRENDEVAKKLEEAWEAAEKAEETIEDLERALQKERKTSERWRSRWESAEGKKVETLSGNEEKSQVHASRTSSRSSNGSSVDWHDERKERKTGEYFSKKCDLKNDRSESGDQRRSSIKCYKCQRMGHIARDCDAKVIHHVETDGAGRGVGAKMRERFGIIWNLIIMYFNMEAESRSTDESNVCIEECFRKGNACERGKKAEVWFQIVEDRAEILLLGTNAFEGIGVELAWKPKQEERIKELGKSPKAKWKRNAKRAKCETSSATVNHIMTEENVVENNLFCRKLMEEGCGCQKRKCTVQEGDNVCSSVQQLGVVLSAKGKGVDLEKWNLFKYSKEFQAQVTTAEKL
ncbi:Protein CBG15505 [Caenorhabditis briggsae]|uniref:Protein CBG15505 n=1 Tax=Caenorhabditis briggsae TaxID=6238 RepID=A8XM68_CAEBR|nr:Protein CBG15505 [Caenorhabditis briggsae]CAP33743.2 Protein CBG15505 [Caenorhabditis briggsae]